MKFQKLILFIIFQCFQFINSQPFLGQSLSYLSSPLIQSLIKGKNISLPLLFEDNYNNYIENSDNITYEEEKERDSLRGKIFTILRDELMSTNISNSNANKKCINVFNKYLFGINDENNLTNISYLRSDYHLIKLLDDSSKSRNYLGAYDQCMFRTYKFKSEISKVDSTFVVLTFDKTDNYTMVYAENDNSSSILDIEFQYYLIALCLPQGTNVTNEYCTDDDYKELIIYLNEKLGDYLFFRNASIDAFTIGNNPVKSKEDSGFYIFLSLLPFIFFALQAFCVIFRNWILLLIKKCFIYYNKKNNNNIIIEDDNKNETSIDDSIENEDERISDVRNKENAFIEGNNKLKLIYKIANCFCFSENGNELFNFSLTSTKYNNDTGLGNLKGIKGISIFFMVVGWTFVVLHSSPNKMYVQFQIQYFLKNSSFIELIIMIGVRYSPRIIISCSGYTLIYKYISFLEKNVINNSEGIFSAVITFFIYQSHKYLLLILLILFERYSIYYLYNFYNELLDNSKPMWKFFYLNILKKPSISKVFLSFILINYFISNEKEEHRNGLNLLHYFWLPFNEIFLFIFGVILITIGYKKKYRIDKLILFLIPLIYISKIVFSYLIEIYLKNQNCPLKKYYPTYYFIFYNYGKFMINPLFNLPYFLIGMYFGLMNYTIQKGIYNITKTNLFKTEERVSMDTKNKKDFENELNQEENDLYYTLDDKINNNDNEQENNNKKNFCYEVTKMPFLMTPIIFVQWHRKQSIKCLYSFFIIFSLLILFFIFFITSVFHYKEEYDFKKIMENKIINFIYRIDIEFVVLFAQWSTFIIFIRGNNFASILLSHIFWTMLSKPYFSFILVINTILLFIFYESETLIELNTMNIFLYSLIGGVLTFIFTNFFYIFFELSYKKLIRLILSLKNNKNEFDVNDNEYQDYGENSSNDDDEEDKEKKE